MQSVSTILCVLHFSFDRVGISYYDSSIRQLSVLEVWEDGAEFPLIDLGMSFPFSVIYFHMICGGISSSKGSTRGVRKVKLLAFGGVCLWRGGWGTCCDELGFT